MVTQFNNPRQTVRNLLIDSVNLINLAFAV
jgi:hypothetical protein